jgi:flagellar biosynthetic protein FlhB
MAERPAQDRTEEATPKHLQEARDRGEVARSIELTSATLFFSSVLLFYFIGASFFQDLAATMRDIYAQLETVNLTVNSAPQLARWWAARGITIAGPILLMILMIALLVNMLQVGVKIAPKALKPNWGRVNPGTGIKRIFSTKGLVELIKGILKMVFIGMIIYVYLAERVKDYPFLTYMTPLQIIGNLGQDLFKIGIYVSIAFMAMALADFSFQKWEHKKKMRMSKQEVKDEYKQAEGSPEVKARIKSVQREMSRNRMMLSVADATVVVTNPTHIAVALKYDEDSDQIAPTVVAKGQRKVAEKIKAIAREADVPIKESPPLARAMFKVCEIGEPIPDIFYQAVAEIFAEIFWEEYGQA